MEYLCSETGGNDENECALPCKFVKRVNLKPEVECARAIAAAPGMTPPDEEWRFDRVQAHEVPVCFLYEYGRRAKKFRERVEAWRKRHPQILPAAQRLLARTGPFALTIGPSLQERKAALLFGECGKTLTKAELKIADENGKAWAEWMGLTMGLAENDKNAKQDLVYPDGLRRDDSRLFLYYFPPFPTVPWQKIQPERTRRIAFLLLTPQPANTQNLVLLILTSSHDFSADMKREHEILARFGKVVDGSTSDSQLRVDIAHHIFAPALRQRRPSVPGQPAANWGLLSLATQLDPAGQRVFLGGIVHEAAQFTINWACSNKAIVKDFQSWLKAKGRRPHPELKTQNLATAREHLNKLSALRLLARLSHKEAVDAAYQAGLYSDEKALRKAAKKADAILKRLFPD